MIVAPYVHTYDTSPRPPYQSQIPPMRAPHDTVTVSNTPIYDALYSEYRRLFRALPFDRSGEEQLRLQPVAPRPAQWHPVAHSPYGTGRPRGVLPAALPPGAPSGGAHANRMHGL
ncbi:hypothetical protein [Streptomyces sp. ICBB 8177]|uniref:hypothetical protein n=1 Tax=Streptomyces sp. ICBB 8177 TaxID=563922 RepID=UPI001F548440|nr:hypothetical protein [Streptomyces sp. ICBB 8177]